MYDAGIDDGPQRGTCAIGMRWRHVVHSDDPFDHVGEHGNEGAATYDDRHDPAASAGETSQRAMHTDDARRRTKSGSDETESSGTGSENPRCSDEVGRRRLVVMGAEVLAHGIDEYVHGV